VEKLSVVASNTSTVDDVPVRATWDRLKAAPTAILIDVRTRAEWTFVGVPDLSSLGRRPFLVEWQEFPDNRPNAAFVNQLAEQLRAAGVDQNTELFFICRSGARSRNAALAMTQAGWTHCHNVAEGFEGPLDGDRHRGTHSGWKVEGLPWTQG
jgi:rhodanese-related sulfurtransferase